MSVSRPAVVNIGAIFTFNSTIGKVAKIAIDEAVTDVISNLSILQGSKLTLTMQNSNCSGFVGMIEGPQYSVVAHIISHVANELQVPALSFAATEICHPFFPRVPFFVRTRQSDLHQMTAVADNFDNYG